MKVNSICFLCIKKHEDTKIFLLEHDVFIEILSLTELHAKIIPIHSFNMHDLNKNILK